MNRRLTGWIQQCANRRYVDEGADQMVLLIHECALIVAQGVVGMDVAETELLMACRQSLRPVDPEC